MSGQESLFVIVAPILLAVGGIISPIFFKKSKALVISTSLFFLIALLVNSWVLLNVRDGGAFVYQNTAGIIVNASTAFIIETALVLGF